jgi:TonB family protein
MTATLVDHLWQSTLFAIAAAALAIAFRNHGANVRYWIWFAASAKFLIPFAALTAIGRSLGWPAAAANLAWAEGITHPMSTFVVAPVDRATVTSVLLAVWLFGSVVVGAFWLIRWLALNDEMRGAKPLRLAHLVGSGVEARVTVSIGPGVVGFFSPVLVLPRYVVQRVAPEHLQPVLQHELAHLRRQDNLTAVVHMIVETVFWFHPLVWLIGARLIDERERACDEFVVASGVDPATYAEGIIEVCRAHAESPLPCTAGVSSAGLKARVAQIVANRGVERMTRRKVLLLVGAAAGSLLAPVLVGVFTARPVAAQVTAQPDSPPSNSPLTTAANASDIMPIVRVPPEYPPRALSSRLEGWVVLEFTITTSGTVKDAVVVEASPAGVFDDAALKAIGRWRYAPSVEGGPAVERQNVRTRVVFELAPQEPESAL